MFTMDVLSASIDTIAGMEQMSRLSIRSLEIAPGFNSVSIVLSIAIFQAVIGDFIGDFPAVNLAALRVSTVSKRVA